MAISFLLDTLDPALAIAIRVIVVRAIRLVGPTEWHIEVGTAFDGVFFYLSVTNSKGREVISLHYVSPVLPSNEVLEASFDSGEYRIPDHPFLVQLEYDLFKEFMRFAINNIAQEPAERVLELQDLASWLNSDRDLVDPPEGVLPASQALLEPPTTSYEFPTVLFHLDPIAHPWPSEDFATVPIFFGTNRLPNVAASEMKSRFTSRRGALGFGLCE